jgi:hypothetical protein
MCVCVFTYSAKKDIKICTKLGMLILWDQEEYLERLKLRKSDLRPSSGEGSSYSSETKQERRKAPRQKLFVSAERRQ